MSILPRLFFLFIEVKSCLQRKVTQRSGFGHVSPRSFLLAFSLSGTNTLHHLRYITNSRVSVIHLKQSLWALMNEIFWSVTITTHDPKWHYVRKSPISLEPSKDENSCNVKTVQKLIEHYRWLIAADYSAWFGCVGNWWPGSSRASPKRPKIPSLWE